MPLLPCINVPYEPRQRWPARLHGWMTPDQTAAAVDAAVGDGHEAWAFKLVLQARDQLAAMLEANDPSNDI